MKKIIKRIGNSVGVIFDKEDCKLYDMELGDFIELTDLVVIKQRSKKK